MSLSQLKKDLMGGEPVDPPQPLFPTPQFNIQAPRGQTKVMICLPSGRSWEARTSTAVAGLCAFSCTQGLSIGIVNLEGSMITKQRNDLIAMALKHDPDYILFIDTDMVFPPDSLMRLLKHNKDIVGATYNKRVPPFETLGTLSGPKPTEEDLRKGGLREAELLPTGFMLMKASIFKTLSWPWFFESYQWDGDSGVGALKNFLRYNYPVPVSDELLSGLDGTPLAGWLEEIHEAQKAQPRWEYFSEDLNFCRKVKRCGVQLFTDLDLTYQMVHLGVHEVTCARPPDRVEEPVVVAAAM